MTSFEGWQKEHVRAWICNLGKDFEPVAEKLFNEGINGEDLLEEIDDIAETEITKPRLKRKFKRALEKLCKLPPEQLQEAFDALQTQEPPSSYVYLDREGSLSMRSASLNLGSLRTTSLSQRKPTSQIFPEAVVQYEYEENYRNPGPDYAAIYSEYLEVGSLEEKQDDGFTIFDELASKSSFVQSSIKVTFAKFDEFTGWRKIGAGNFGYAFVARWDASDLEQKNVVVKVSKHVSKQNELQEIQIFFKLPSNHANVLPILGIIQDFDHPAYRTEHISNNGIVTPLMKFGDLSSYAKKFKDELKEGNNFHQIALGMARGVSALHNKIPNIVHRDIGIRNFLVSEVGRVVIADFGMSRETKDGTISGEADDSYVNEKSVFAWRWSAPECFSDHKWTLKTDVWMYGISLWELIALETPFKNVKNALQLSLHLLNGRLNLETPKGMPLALEKVMRRCTQLEAKERPTMLEVVDYLVNHQGNVRRLVEGIENIGTNAAPIQSAEEVLRRELEGGRQKALLDLEQEERDTEHVPIRSAEEELRIQSERERQRALQKFEAASKGGNVNPMEEHYQIPHVSPTGKRSLRRGGIVDLSADKNQKEVAPIVSPTGRRSLRRGGIIDTHIAKVRNEMEPVIEKANLETDVEDAEQTFPSAKSPTRRGGIVI